jgi:isocitrate dehydrogenase
MPWAGRSGSYGLLVAATQLLVHVGVSEVAQRIKNAWLRTLEDGIHPPDIYREGLSQHEVGTRAFTDAVIDRLGETPRQREPVQYTPGGIHATLRKRPGSRRSCAASTYLSTGIITAATPMRSGKDFVPQRILPIGRWR